MGKSIPIRKECLDNKFMCNSCSVRYLCYTNSLPSRKCSDLEYAFDYNNTPFEYEDILAIWAAVYGANDGSDWFWVVQLSGNKYSLVRGGCDYTGWD